MRTSTYVNFGIPKFLWPYFPEGYFLLRARCGIPFVGKGTGVIEITWIAKIVRHVFGQEIQEALDPVLAPTYFASETVNAALFYGLFGSAHQRAVVTMALTLYVGAIAFAKRRGLGPFAKWQSKDKQA